MNWVRISPGIHVQITINFVYEKDISLGFKRVKPKFQNFQCLNVLFLIFALLLMCFVIYHLLLDLYFQCWYLNSLQEVQGLKTNCKIKKQNIFLAIFTTENCNNISSMILERGKNRFDYRSLCSESQCSFWRKADKNFLLITDLYSYITPYLNYNIMHNF